MKVYFISGLGADRRVFTHIRLPEGFEPVFLDWIKPQKHESLQEYAFRLAEGIDRKEKFVLIGLSMGGMIATEIAKVYKPLSTILISSAPVDENFPRRFKFAYALGIYRMVPVFLLKSASVAKRLFTTESKEDKKLLKQVIRETDPHFVRWALQAILSWRNHEKPDHLWHIHGDTDEIIPLTKKASPTHIIHKGTHMMILSRAAELNKILAEIVIPLL